MAIERWRRPWAGIWKELEDMEMTMDSLISGVGTPTVWRRTPSEVGWTPPMEVYDKGEEFVARAELPGINKEDIDISVTGDTLTVSGERKAEEEVKEKDYYRCELCYGKFSRALTLPAAVETENINAIYKDGVLEIKLPKSKEAKPKKIDISVK